MIFHGGGGPDPLPPPPLDPPMIHVYGMDDKTSYSLLIAGIIFKLCFEFRFFSLTTSQDKLLEEGKIMSFQQLFQSEAKESNLKFRLFLNFLG